MLTTSAADQLTASYLDAGNAVQSIGPYTPRQLIGAAASAPWYYADQTIIGKTGQGVHTFYLTFEGKTDTLGLHLQDECGYHPSATFNGRPVSETPSVNNAPSYLVLQRQH